MSTAVSRGKTSPTTNMESIRFGPAQADESSVRIHGPKEALRALIPTLKAAGYSGSYEADSGPNAVINYQTVGVIGGSGGTAGTETPTLVWEYLANVAEIDLFEFDKNGINSISLSDKVIIREAIASPTEGQSPALTDPTAIAIYNLMLSGVRSAQINVPTLKVSKIVSGSYAVKASLTNVDKVITTATLQIQEAIPSTILFNLPTSSTVTKYAETFTYAWHKKHPQVTQAGGNKWNVSQEWQWGLWPATIYGTAI